MRIVAQAPRFARRPGSSSTRDQPQREPGAGAYGGPGVGDQLVGDLAAHDRVAPLVELDELGQQLVAQPARPAAGPVDPEPPAHEATAARSWEQPPVACSTTSWGRVPSSERTRRA